MFVSRLIIKNFRNLAYIDIPLTDGLNVVVGDNGAGKSNLIYALRLLLDPSLPYTARQLDAEDFNRATNGPQYASQIIIAAEFDYSPDDESESNFAIPLLHENVPRLAFRFRPSPTVRFQLEHEGRVDGTLTLDDYEPELVIGRNVDFRAISWKDELGKEPRGNPQARYNVVELPALRDVLQVLKNQRTSPLARLLDTLQFDQPVQQNILQALSSANVSIASTQAFRELSHAITASYEQLIGDLNPLSVSLGFSEPSLPQILRSLNLLVSDGQLTQYSLERNGLGFNNMLYAAMQIEYFRRGTTEGRPGKLLLIEEPEAHLHPQAQESFLETLRDEPVQTVVTTHSAHVTSKAGVGRILAFSRTQSTARATAIAAEAGLSVQERLDLDRYLDATKASLLFARRVLLVEGGAELQLMPAFAQQLSIDLARRGISVIAVHGTHFSVFRKLFETGALASRCAIVSDNDDFRDATGEPDTRYDDGTSVTTRSESIVRDFKTRTTLEYAICQRQNLDALKTVATDLGAPRAVATYESAQQTGELGEAQRQTYRLAIRFGKARFSQLLAKHPVQPPHYIYDALTWINQ